MEKSLPEVKAEITTNGDLTVVHDYGVNPDGSPAQSRWDIRPQQIGAHLRGSNDKDHPFHRMSPGDKSAALDAYHANKNKPMT
jgi:hypothetical protein